MLDRKSNNITIEQRAFLDPQNATHRQYEALRAYFIDQVPAKEVAKQFAYSYGSFRALCYEFRKNPNRAFFLPPKNGPQSSPKKDSVRDEVIKMRKQNFSVYDIERALKEMGKPLSSPSIYEILTEEGFARLPRRDNKDRLQSNPDKADVADVEEFQLTNRQFRTKFGGLFLFGVKIGNGYETAKSRHIFRDFIDAVATIIVSDKTITVKFQKKAHNPYLLNKDFYKKEYTIPWWNGCVLKFQFG